MQNSTWFVGEIRYINGEAWYHAAYGYQNLRTGRVVKSLNEIKLSKK